MVEIWLHCECLSGRKVLAVREIVSNFCTATVSCEANPRDAAEVIESRQLNSMTPPKIGFNGLEQPLQNASLFTI